ncbi:MAG: DUF2130 domain-containing protein [Coriobacteriales bacterium]|nr:DUF2130 domain-containing protein [Coriobacteriales bacterium]
MAEIKCPNCGTIISLEQSDLDSVVLQVRDEQFQKELAERASYIEADKQREIELVQAQAATALKEQAGAKDARIAELQAQLAAQRETLEAQHELAVTQAVATVEKERDALAASIEVKEAEKARAEATFKEQLAEQAKAKDDIIAFQKDEIERMKDMKARLSTKMVGESLEQHCQYEFDRIRAIAFPNAYFEKDNEAVEGTKGDFVFREEDEDGNEIISIMFEMKNEGDKNSVKKKNEDHFAKLDKDRTKKGCEYAILVSLLEPDSELYNEGIVDVSHRYPKMYVVRPQFFIPIISLLRNAALSSLEYKRELALVRQQDLDITTFEDDLETFKQGFFKNFKDASLRFDDAVKAIDKAIADLQKAKDKLLTSEKHLTAANNKLEGLTVKKLTRKNPTMKAKFDALKEADGED